MAYESDSVFAAKLPYNTDNHSSSKESDAKSWRISDAPDGHDAEMATDEWEEKRG
jgi:hypothetical protein